MKNSKKITKISLIIILISIVLIVFVVAISGGDNEPTNSNMIYYAQYVIKDYYPDAVFPSDENAYTVVLPTETNLRAKVKGTCSVDSTSSSELFEVVIEFTDDTFTEYELRDLYVNGETLYGE